MRKIVYSTNEKNYVAMLQKHMSALKQQCENSEVCVFED